MKSNGRKIMAIVLAMILIVSTMTGCAPKERTSVESIDKDTKLSVLFNSIEMGDFAEFLIYRSDSYARKLQKKTLNDLNRDDSSWNADAMEYGLNHILTLIHSGVKVDYDFWSEEDIKADKTKENTKLFYFPAKEDAPFVLLCAGGGFTAVCSMVEAFPVAAELNKLGYNVFVLSYRTQKASLKVDMDMGRATAMEDVAAAIKYIFSHAADFAVSTGNYAMGGFSAGAMLTADWCSQENGWGKYGLEKPACAFLAYGGISNTDKITDTYPATYMVYCEDDPIVSAQTMSTMADTLKQTGVPYLQNVGKSGGHGFGLGLGTDVEGWVEEAVELWQQQIGG